MLHFTMTQTMLCFRDAHFGSAVTDNVKKVKSKNKTLHFSLSIAHNSLNSEYGFLVKQLFSGPYPMIVLILVERLAISLLPLMSYLWRNTILSALTVL